MKQHYTKVLALFSFLLVLGSCKKDSGPNSSPIPAFFGYTGWDFNANMPGPNDDDDWTVDPTWNSAELNLFAKYNIDSVYPLFPANTYQIAAIPNPVVQGGNVHLRCLVPRGAKLPVLGSDLRIAYAVVNPRYKVLEEGFMDSDEKEFHVTIPFDASKYPFNNLYRVYYVIYNNKDMRAYYRGHGDILVLSR